MPCSLSYSNVKRSQLVKICPALYWKKIYNFVFTKLSTRQSPDTYKYTHIFLPPMSLSLQVFPSYFGPIYCCNSISVLTIKKTCCKWFPFSLRHASHLTKSLFIARRSSTGQVEEATSQTTSLQNVFSATIILFTLPYNIPHKKTQMCSNPLNGKVKIPCRLFCRHEKDAENCWLCNYLFRKIFPHQTQVFLAICSRLECNLFPEIFPRVCKSFSCLEQISSEITTPLLAVRCSANVVYETASCSNQIPMQTAGNS
jgi:hypothetical protein